MKFPTVQSAGIGTTGATGLVILAGVIFANISTWWLILSTFLILIGIGQENRANKFYENLERNIK